MNPYITFQVDEYGRYFEIQVHPLDNAVYHTEYVMRHKGARHLQQKGPYFNDVSKVLDFFDPLSPLTLSQSRNHPSYL